MSRPENFYVQRTRKEYFLLEFIWKSFSIIPSLYFAIDFLLIVRVAPKRLHVGLKYDVHKGFEEIEEKPAVNHLDVGGRWQVGADTEEHRGQHQHHRHVEAHQTFEEELLEVVGHVTDDVEDDGRYERC